MLSSSFIFILKDLFFLELVSITNYGHQLCPCSVKYLKYPQVVILKGIIQNIRYRCNSLGTSRCLLLLLLDILIHVLPYAPVLFLFHALFYVPVLVLFDVVFHAPVLALSHVLFHAPVLALSYVLFHVPVLALSQPMLHAPLRALFHTLASPLQEKAVVVKRNKKCLII